MKNAIIFLSIFIFFTGLFAQDPIESFDGAITEFQDLWLSGNGTLDLSYDSTLAGHEGAACLEAKWKIDVVEWGGGISFGHYTASNEVIDLSARDTLSLWYYVKVPGKLDSVDLTLILRDQPSASAYAADNQNVELWLHDVHGVYTNTEPGWHEIVIPQIIKMLNFGCMTCTAFIPILNPVGMRLLSPFMKPRMPLLVLSMVAIALRIIINWTRRPFAAGTWNGGPGIRWLSTPLIQAWCVLTICRRAAAGKRRLFYSMGNLYPRIIRPSPAGAVRSK